MKIILVATVLSLSMATNVCAQVQPAIPSDARIEKKVESLLKKDDPGRESRTDV